MKLIILCILAITFGLAGVGLLIAEIIDAAKARKARKEGLFVYRYPF